MMEAESKEGRYSFSKREQGKYKAVKIITQPPFFILVKVGTKEGKQLWVDEGELTGSRMFWFVQEGKEV